VSRRARGTLLAVVIAVGCTACGGGATVSASPPHTSASPSAAVSPTPSPSSLCTPSGSALKIAARNVGSIWTFDTGCLAAPAGAPFTIAFDNQSPGVSHNIDILDFPGGIPLFSGEVFLGPKTIIYKVKALDAGTYYFHCRVHPSLMNGHLIVG
jgi:plastocyanin